VRVIRDASKDIEKTTVCKNCGTELGFIPVDVKSERHYDYTGDFDIFKYVKCPNCKKKIGVS